MSLREDADNFAINAIARIRRNCESVQDIPNILTVKVGRDYPVQIRQTHDFQMGLFREGTEDSLDVLVSRVDRNGPFARTRAISRRGWRDLG